MPSGMALRVSEIAATSTSSRVMVSRFGNWEGGVEEDAAAALVVGSVMGAEAGSATGGACAGAGACVGACVSGAGAAGLLPHQERCRTPPIEAAVAGARILHCAVVCDSRARGRCLDESCSLL